MESGRFVLLIVALTYVLHSVRGGCHNERHITICPFPVFIAPDRNVTLVVVCKLGNLGFLDKLEVGVVDGNNYKVTAYKFPGESAKYRTKGAKFTPQSPSRLASNATSLTLTLDPVHVRDLAQEFYCGVEYRNLPTDTEYRNTGQSQKMMGIPYPIGTTFRAISPKATYDSSDIVALQCKALTALIVSRSTRLRFAFQTRLPQGWTSIEGTDTTQTAGTVAGEQVPAGLYYRQLFILRLRVSSISGCSRRYRCVLSYGERVFEEEAAEHVINVTACTGGCMLESCKTTTTTSSARSSDHTTDMDDRATDMNDRAQPTADSTTASEFNNDDDNDEENNDTKSSSVVSSGRLVLGVGLASALAVIALLAIIVVMLRRRRSRRQRMERRPSAGGDRIIVVGIPSAMPSVYTETSVGEAVGGFSSQPSQSQPSLSYTHSSRAPSTSVWEGSTVTDMSQM